LGQLLVRCGSLTARELEAGLLAQSGGAGKLGNILVEQGAVPPAVVEAALVKQTQSRRAQEQRSVRVDADKLDELINLVGELIIASARTKQLSEQVSHDALRECASGLAGLVEDVRDHALQLRMVKIGATFSRFQRVVHDVAREIGKDIELQVSGEET